MASEPSRTHPRSPSAQEAHVVNRAHWDAVAALHTGDEEFHARLRAHGTTLHPIELAELSPRVAGKSLLHLQCHTGMDTMSWVKKGAGPVVGIDSLRRPSKPLATSPKSFESRPSSSSETSTTRQIASSARSTWCSPLTASSAGSTIRDDGRTTWRDWSRRAGCSTW